MKHEYSYVLDYIDEAVRGREALRQIIGRATLAYKKKPSRHIYRENANSYYQSTKDSFSFDQESRDSLKRACDSIPEATDDTIFNAVETVVSMAMGGAGQFQTVPFDKYMEKDSELIDRQEMYLDHVYNENKLDAVAPETVRKLIMQGQFNYLIQPTKGDNGTTFKVSLIDAYKMLIDPRRSKSNKERFTGYTEMRSWSDIKDAIKKSGDKYSLNVIPDVDQYMSELNSWTLAEGSGRFTNEIYSDLDTFGFYGMAGIKKGSEALNNDGSPDTPIDKGYRGDDIEVAYLWDIDNKIYFEVVNRRFIIKAKKNPLSSTIEVKVPYLKDGKWSYKNEKVKVEIDSPIVSRGLIDADWETYPISPLWYCLDEFDKLCSKQSIKDHNLSIMAPITFIATSSDAEILSGLSQIAGQIAEGTTATMGVFNKQHDMSAIMQSISDSKESIKRSMGATDQYELMQLMNNRATGAEVTMANAAVSQRMNIALAKLEDGYRELMTKVLRLQIIDGDTKEFFFPYKDGMSLITDQELLSTTITDVRLKSRVKVEMQEQSRNALMVMQTITALAQSGAVDIKRAFSILIPRIMQGTVSRREAMAMVSDDINFSREDIDQMIAHQRELAKKERIIEKLQEQLGPIPEGTSLEELNQIEQLLANGDLSSVAQSNLDPNRPMFYPADPETGMPVEDSPQPDPQPTQQLSTGANGQPIPAGMSPEMAGQVANEAQLGVM